MGLRLSTDCVGSVSGILDKQVMADEDGPGCPVGFTQSEDKKGKKKVTRLGRVKIPQRVWRVKSHTGAVLGISGSDLSSSTMLAIV